MTLIKVDPSLLQGSARSIQSKGQIIASKGNHILAVAESAPSYDGKFGPQVAAIGAAAYSRASGLAGNIIDLGERLFVKAVEFETVDSATIAGFENVFFNEAQTLERWARLTGISVNVLARYLRLGMLLGGPGFYGLLMSILIGRRLPAIPPSSSAPSSSSRPQISVPVRQDDPNWATDPMGPNGTMKEYGCAVTALTMLARYQGVDITPKDYNDWLRENDGYVNGSNLDWNKAQEYLNSILPNHGTLVSISGVDAINAELNAGHPVVLHVPGPTGDGHYVLAVPPPGSNGIFTAFDPLTGMQKTFSEIIGAQSFQ